jgi:predicted pyridoxine 5'-phosphate oxidase superfamily flavin-nucleotide-binding protein
MSQSFARIAFTPLVKEQQIVHGSRRQYERVEQFGATGDRLTEAERAFIADRDSFYMASVSETGWPYIQHRGGAQGFLHVLDDHTLIFADSRGNKQYISLGNLMHDNRVALFLMDYPSQTRLKILGHARIHEGDEAKEMLDKITTPQERAVVERVIEIQVEAFDWNCQQYITPRYSEEQVVRLLAPTRQRVAELEQENKRLRAELAGDAKK